jgi:hypothetical protein
LELEFIGEMMIFPTWALTPIKWILDAAIRSWLEPRKQIAKDFHSIRRSLKSCIVAYGIDWHLARFQEFLDRNNPDVFIKPGMAVFYEKWIQPAKRSFCLWALAPTRKAVRG